MSVTKIPQDIANLLALFMGVLQLGFNRGQKNKKLLCLLLSLAGYAFQAAAQPANIKHVASLNLCSDQLVLSLLRSQDIAALSKLSQNCSESVMCVRARAFATIRPEGEEILKYHPTHIIEGLWGHHSVQKIAQLQNIPFYQLPPVQKLDDITKQIKDLALWLDVPSQGETVIHEFTSSLHEIRSHLKPPLLKAAFYGDNDDLLLEDLLKEAGFISLSGQKKHYRVFSAETLLINPPDLLVSTKLNEGASLKEQKSLPPILLNHFNGPHLLIIPMKYSLCGTPRTLHIMKLLVQSHNALLDGE
ncbi:ABC transporter substrate-binding protein [Aristophania vespae]|uniref:ABC transporter substrate-binding protein n=1 Tax=Aristophania vespae TaxID=2697033 RepID=UPI0023514933|nr:ABC transporter substrate-binding protein [Aristophania vespae]